ncbi:acyltransferase [Dokdonella sp. MW10]|uniref:acyltransferase n=1 Tax=Dokdonella sp. MW10 TaxID=2992926 RepID=UPI003F7CFA0A
MSGTSWRQWAARSPHPLARAARGLRKRLVHFTLPAPRVVVLPMLWVFLALRAVVFFVRSKFIAEPLLKAYATRVGRGVTAGIYVPWVIGRGELVLEDYARFDGKVSINFAASFVARPRLVIGAYTDVAHGTSFVVGREIRIGAHVQIAANVSFRDSGGHASDPELRKAGAPPSDDDVKAIVVHDNVWIGNGAMILPGVEIGEGSIVAARSIVSGTVAPYTIVAGNPARRVGTLPRPGEAATAEATPPPAS